MWGWFLDEDITKHGNQLSIPNFFCLFVCEGTHLHVTPQLVRERFLLEHSLPTDFTLCLSYTIQIELEKEAEEKTEQR